MAQRRLRLIIGITDASGVEFMVTGVAEVIGRP
jgi:hypothetical protein